MSADKNPFIQREIQALQHEEPRPDAKGDLILALMKEKRESKMSILRKASLPTLVSIAAIAGVFYVSQPRVMAATPDRVIKAIQDIKNYTIKSFLVNGDQRHLQSKTTVSGKDRNTVYYDDKGNETKANADAKIVIGDSPMKLGFTVDSNGDLKGMSKEDIDKMKAQFHIQLDGKSMVGHGDVRVEVKKGPDGKEEKHYFVNGKEVDKLPEGMEGHFKVTSDNATVPGSQNVRVMVTKDANGKETKHIYVNGKEVDKLPEGVVISDGKNMKNTVKVEIKKGPDGKEEKHYFVNGKEVDKLPGNLSIQVPDISGKGEKGMIMLNNHDVKNGSVHMNKAVSVMSRDGEKPMIVQSGNTSADYLVELLRDTTKWTIERGVTFNGQKLDKFTLKGPVSPIVLYVDPATALPKVLRFETPFEQGRIIEDVYEYSIQP